MLNELAQWILTWGESSYAIWALFLLAVAEASFFPLPPDLLLVALLLSDSGRGLWLATVTTVGSVVGGIIGYYIGFLGGRPLLKRFVAENAIGLTERYFDRYGGWTVVIAGFTPVPYKVFTIASGAFVLKFPIFVLASCIGRGGRFFVVAGAIQLFGAQVIPLIDRYFNAGSLVVVVAIIVCVLLFHVFRRSSAA